MTSTREGDDRLLAMVRMRARGFSVLEVARHFGVATSSITTQTNKVMDADQAHSTTEKTADVAAEYWPRK